MTEIYKRVLIIICLFEDSEEESKKHLKYLNNLSRTTQFKKDFLKKYYYQLGNYLLFSTFLNEDLVP